MPGTYILAIDQSTQGTKGMVFDQQGRLVARADQAHEQIINEKGWVEHDPVGIYQNVLTVAKKAVEQAGIDKAQLAAVGISNQRETSLAWNRETGEPIYQAIVWQCARGEEICRRLMADGLAETIKAATGLPLSPYFSAAKLAWIVENVKNASELMSKKNLCMGTIDSWLVYKLTKGQQFKTDFSNASRTQLFNIRTLQWDAGICQSFGIEAHCLAQVCDSNASYGETDFDGWLEAPIPIRAVLGDSHGALFGQQCCRPGMVKATYGTGSSVMLNIGDKPIFSTGGLVTSLAWSFDGSVEYVLEGNINYTGAVISWLKDRIGLIASATETAELAEDSNSQDKSYLVPAFTGLGAPHWDSEATALLTGMTRVTGKNEIVRAALDSIAYQIDDIVTLMQCEAGIAIQELRADGGPTKNHYLMQFQADLLSIPVQVPAVEELSGMGAAYAAGIAIGLYDKKTIFEHIGHEKYQPQMPAQQRELKKRGWQAAVSQTLHHA
jgi:Glycerol kinase